MEIIRDKDYDAFRLTGEHPAFVALGIFDGVHRGHQQIVKTTVDLARSRGGQAIVYTFANHPAEVLAGRRVPPRLMSMERRLQVFEELGVDITVMPEFTLSLSQMPPEDFVQQVLLGKLRITHAVVGANYRFGHKRAGDASLLKEMGAVRSFGVTVIEPLNVEGEPISSTRIRNALATGDLSSANAMLGRPMEIDGVIIEGERRGRTLGIPTINLSVDDLCPLSDGVYATRTVLRNHPPLIGVGYIGRKPTFHGDVQPRILEVHLFDLDEDLYGQTAVVEVHKHLRTSERFGGAEELVAQIRRDIHAAREYFAQGSE